MMVQMALTSQALSQYVKDQATLVQQIAVTGEAVVHLAGDRNHGAGLDGGGQCSGVHNRHPQGGA
jgi:hypothetical protein